MIPEPPPLSLYVHLPWCVRKCPYCDFNSHERPGELPEQAYLRVLLADLEEELARVAGRRIETVFFGGGTPSLLSADFYREFLTRLEASGQLAPDAEITLEANPGTLEAGRFEGFREAGINRLSIGAQSFDALQLHNLGRIHGPEEAIEAARAARRAGFDDFNLDLMHGLPGQTRAQALADLEQAIALEPTHVSWYELTIEPNTAFWSRPPSQPDPDRHAETEAAGFGLLAAHGYERYEISAFARTGRRCQHNLNYWHFGDYLGIGAGAHGKITAPEGILRYRKTRRPEDYLAPSPQTPLPRGERGFNAGTASLEGSLSPRGRGTGRGGASEAPVVNESLAPGWRRIEECFVPEAEQPLEFLMNALRLMEGVPRDWLDTRTTAGEAAVRERLAELRRSGLLINDTERLACTEQGIRHLDSVLTRFVS